jgi:competence protein ComEC
VSAGHGNIFGHPAPDVLSRFEQRGTVVFRTDRDGAIIMETDGAAVDVRTWSGRRWSIRAMQN